MFQFRILTVTSSRRAARRCRAWAGLLPAWLVALCWPAAGAWASLDLRDAHVQRLDNGLTVLVLEHRDLPAVSVQMLYRAGGRDEQFGATGLAHFVEHMAFRDTQNFPDTGVVSQIYGVGGEWHGYTWVDQTTYFATVPVEHLDLALRIEADRMDRLLLRDEHLEPERGAVLAELHGYENDPSMVLHDQLVFAAFQGHPYRNNVIGFERDIQSLDMADVRAFYRRYYRPANAALAIVGDVDTAAVIDRVRELFGGFEARPAETMPRSVEAAQRGVRRIELSGPSTGDLFEVLYQAPSARSPDFPAFLVLQALLSSSTGVNFQQDGGQAPATDGSLLHGLADDLRTWYPPAAQTYAFSIAGSVPAGSDRRQLETQLETRLATLRDELVPDRRLAETIGRVRQALVFDVQTTEDAAHQLAYFDGLGALPVLLGLDQAVAGVSAEQLRQVARRYLQPWQRNIGWFASGRPPAGVEAAGELAPVFGPPQSGRAAPPGSNTLPAQTHSLAAGLPLIVQRAPASPTVYLLAVFAGEGWVGTDSGEPVAGHSALAVQAPADGFEAAVANLAEGVGGVAGAEEPGLGIAPEARLERLMLAQSGWRASPGGRTPAPVLLVAVGDLDPGQAVNVFGRHLGELAPGEPMSRPTPGLVKPRAEDWLDFPVAQAGLGYVVSAPAPDAPQSLAWQALLYILSHGYEGRLGKEAISRRGLVYYIDAAYRSDGSSALVTLATGVDPHKFEHMEKLLREQLQDLVDRPPGEAEVAEARRYMLGRYRTAAQANAERASALAREWLWYARLRPPEVVERAIGELTREQVLGVVPAFVSGGIATVRPR